jgi:hypothetical protein
LGQRTYDSGASIGSRDPGEYGKWPGKAGSAEAAQELPYDGLAADPGPRIASREAPERSVAGVFEQSPTASEIRSASCRFSVCHWENALFSCATSSRIHAPETDLSSILAEVSWKVPFCSSHDTSTWAMRVLLGSDLIPLMLVIIGTKSQDSSANEQVVGQTGQTRRVDATAGFPYTSVSLHSARSSFPFPLSRPRGGKE